MFSLPKDCESTITDKYKDIPPNQIHSIIDDVISEIVKKTTFDSACTIRGLGKFVCFKIFDKLQGRDFLRFKFIPSYTFKTKINSDEHLMRRAPIKTPSVFRNEQLKNDPVAIEQSKYSKDASFKATTYSRKRTSEKLAEKVIMDILKNRDDVVDPRERQ